MPTVTLYLRDGHAPPEEVDLDALSPMARALAESVDQRESKAKGVIWIRSRRPLREIIVGDGAELFYSAEELDQPDQQPWSGWSPYREDSPATPVEYLEYTARQIPLGWHPIGAHPQTPVPSSEAASGQQLLTRNQLVAYLHRLGHPVSLDTWSSYVSRGLAPQPSKRIGRTPLWSEDVVLEWTRSRTGQGQRTDLRAHA